MKKLSRFSPFIPAIVGFAPLCAFAASDLESILDTLKSLANGIIPLFMLLAVAVFLWGIVKYVTAGGDEANEKKARGLIIYGLIGIFVMVAFWGIIQIFADTFGIQTGGSPNFPDISL
ncbi:MAG: hypothetical protein PHC85_01545 [Candidatus Pacebacteria bacterium]|nr:hypothetical protein [Candidatus Paceibacterota bacterium]